MDSKSLSHSKWKCQYHIVFIPKYRKKVLYGQVRQDVREIISTLCKYKGGKGITQAMQSEEENVLLSIPKNHYFSTRYNEISMAEIHSSETWN